MKVLKNYIYNLTYQIVAIILPLVTIPYASRVLGAELIGINSYTNTIISYFLLIANIGLTVYGNRTISYTRDDISKRSQKFWEILLIKLIMALFSLVLFSIFILVYAHYQLFLCLQSIQILATAIDISWFFTGMEDFKKTVTRNIFTKILSAILILSLVNGKDDLWIYILILALSTLLGNLTLWSYIFKFVERCDLKSLQLKEHIKPVFILFIPQLATTLFLTLNKLLLGNLSTLSQAGYFDSSDKVIRMLLTFITAVGTVSFPRLANSFNNGHKGNVQKILKLSFDAVSIIAFPMSVGMLIAGETFSPLFFGSQFKGIEIVLGILSVELIFMGWSSILGNQFLVAINKTKGLTVSVFIASFILLISSFVLIPILGATGASISSVIGEATIALVQLYYVSKYTKLCLLFSDTPKFLVSSLIMGASCWVIGSYFYDGVIKLFVQGTVGLVVYCIMIWFSRPEIINTIVKKINIR